MKTSRKLMVFMCLLAVTVFALGCGVSEKVNTLKDDLISITTNQVATQLESSLNQQFPGVQVAAPKVLDSKGQINWAELKKTKLGNYVFYSVGDYEFKSVLSGDGVFKIVRNNRATEETVSYAEFKVERVDGKFKVTAK